MDEKVMNEYELNGRLMEISLALGCEFLDLVFIPEIEVTLK